MIQFNSLPPPPPATDASFTVSEVVLRRRLSVDVSRVSRLQTNCEIVCACCDEFERFVCIEWFFAGG